MPVHAGGDEFILSLLGGALGADRATLSPDAWQIEAWQDNPLSIGAAQADFGGYTPNVWPSNDWIFDDLEIVTSTNVDIGTPTSTGTDGLRYWGMRSTSSGILVYSAPLGRIVSVSAGSDPVLIRPRIRIPTS